MNVAHYSNSTPLRSAPTTDPGLRAVPALCQLRPLHGLFLPLEMLFLNIFTSFQTLLKGHLPWRPSRTTLLSTGTTFLFWFLHKILYNVHTALTCLSLTPHHPSTIKGQEFVCVVPWTPHSTQQSSVRNAGGTSDVCLMN